MPSRGPNLENKISCILYIQCITEMTYLVSSAISLNEEACPCLSLYTFFFQLGKPPSGKSPLLVILFHDIISIVKHAYSITVTFAQSLFPQAHGYTVIFVIFIKIKYFPFQCLYSNILYTESPNFDENNENHRVYPSALPVSFPSITRCYCVRILFFLLFRENSTIFTRFCIICTMFNIFFK